MQNMVRDVMLHREDQPHNPAMPLRRGFPQHGHPSDEEDEEKEENRADEHEYKEDFSRWDRHGCLRIVNLKLLMEQSRGSMREQKTGPRHKI
jgi:hypothetical protein